MNRSIVIVILCLAAASVAAQPPTINSADIQNAFANQKRIAVNSTHDPAPNVNLGTSGLGLSQTFNFSAVPNQASRDSAHQQFTAPAGQPGAANFPNADMAFPIVFSPFPGATIEIVQYWQLEGDGLYHLGEYIHQSFPPFIDTSWVSKFLPRQLLVPLPLTYGTNRTSRDTVYTDESAGDFEVNDRMFICDAYGDITFPGAAVPGAMQKAALVSCLRLRVNTTTTTYFGGSASGSFDDLEILFLSVDGSYLAISVLDPAYTTGSTDIDAMDYGYNPGTTGVREAGGAVPDGYTLEQNYPNPFNPATSIRFGIPEAAFVTLKVYDQLGREVALLVNEQLAPGSYTSDFDASRLSSGVYIYRLTAGSFTESGRMTLVR